MLKMEIKIYRSKFDNYALNSQKIKNFNSNHSSKFCYNFATNKDFFQKVFKKIFKKKAESLEKIKKEFFEG